MTILSAAGCSSGKAGSVSADSADLTWQFWVGGSADTAAWTKVADHVTEDHPGMVFQRHFVKGLTGGATKG